MCGDPLWQSSCTSYPINTTTSSHFTLHTALSLSRSGFIFQLKSCLFRWRAYQARYRGFLILHTHTHIQIDLSLYGAIYRRNGCSNMTPRAAHAGCVYEWAKCDVKTIGDSGDDSRQLRAASAGITTLPKAPQNALGLSRVSNVFRRTMATVCV